MKPLALQLYTLRQRSAENFFGVLREVAEIGYAGVELAGLFDHKVEEVRKVLDDLGLICASSDHPPVTAENLSQAVDFAGALGCTLFMGGWNRDDWQTLDGVKRAADAYQQANELLEPHGIRLCYHNHWWEMHEIDGKLALEHFLELAPAAWAQMDVYWASNFGKVDVPALLTKWSARVPMLHIKDGPLVEGEPHTAVGAGKMDIPACIAAASEETLEWLIVELDECAGDMTQAVRESYAYMTTNALAKGSK